jgi:hypothetical protein
MLDGVQVACCCYVQDKNKQQISLIKINILHQNQQHE